MKITSKQTTILLIILFLLISIAIYGENNFLYRILLYISSFVAFIKAIIFSKSKKITLFGNEYINILDLDLKMKLLFFSIIALFIFALTNADSKNKNSSNNPKYETNIQVDENVNVSNFSKKDIKLIPDVKNEEIMGLKVE